MRTTTKTMVKLFGRTYCKTWGFFVMKGAQTHVVCATFFELDILTHHIDDIDAGEQILDEGLWNQNRQLKITAISVTSMQPLPMQTLPSYQRDLRVSVSKSP